MKSVVIAPVVVLAVGVLALSGCAPAPSKTPVSSPASASDAPADPDYCARMVTNSGGLQDRSFNQSSWEGLQAAGEKYDFDAQAIVSKAETDIGPNVQQAVDTGCQYILTVGWELADATMQQAAENPDVHFSLVDEQADAPNIKPIVFNTAEASYLAGYLAAGVTKTGKVGTFGGDNQPPVTLFMDGFSDGIGKYNEVHGTRVELLGWNKAKQDGLFTGDYEDTTKGKQKAQALLDAGADVILPVAGQVGEGAAAAVLDAGGNTSIIWVDNDGYETLPAQFKPIVLTSVLKNTQDAVVNIVADDIDGIFDNTPFIGTLANGGVEIALYHDRAPLVSEKLAGEIDQLRADVIAGKIKVESPSAPN